jgi:D-alanyl-D-alanine carboxypeptidase (penicillin-binding protein 5/6)
LLPAPFQTFSAAEEMAEGECVIDVESRRILYENNGEKRLPMASTTNILTAITVIERIDDLDKEYIIPKEAVGIEGSSVYLKEGDILTVRDLLYGLMLRSGNDCAVALAHLTAGGEKAFSVCMNETSQKAGAKNSHFITPHGLPQNGHYTTARDLAYITAYAMENPVFSEIVKTKYYPKMGWKNKNKMLFLCEDGVGVKTGYTKEAGRCLVSAIKREERTHICVVLSCPDTYSRSKKLLNDSFSAYKRVKIHDKNTGVVVESQKGKRIVAQTKEDVYYPLLDEEKHHIRKEILPLEGADAKKKGEIVGEMKIYLVNRLLFSAFLYKL